jgi:hypothetical protein
VKKLRLHTKLGYGTAELGVLAVETLARLHVLKFYTDVVGLRAELAGGAAALAIAWDAFVDPLVGLASDRTRSSDGAAQAVARRGRHRARAHDRARLPPSRIREPGRQSRVLCC